MQESNQSSKENPTPKKKAVKGKKLSSDKNKQAKSKFQSNAQSNDEDVLLSLPLGFKYKLPGKRQRVVVASVVVGLNALLVVAVIVYFYNPAFQQFIYNIGRT